MTITELAGATGVSKHTLRYYARQAILATHRKRVVATITALQRHRALLDRKLRAGCAPGDLKPRT